jgi:hypothetical protein
MAEDRANREKTGGEGLAGSPSDRAPARTPSPADVGRREADRVDLALLLRESHAREQRLIERAIEAEERLGDALRNEHDLRDQIDRLVRFNRAVERSASWRALQAARSVVGRKW